MEFLNTIYNEILLPIIKQLITTDTVLIMSLTIGMTEFIKQGFKHYKKVNSLDNWTIRGISIIFGNRFFTNFSKISFNSPVFSLLNSTKSYI